jgi:hypothetical protein
MTSVSRLFGEAAFALMVSEPANLGLLIDTFTQNDEQLVLRLVRGKRMHHESGVLDEFAAAWQFPWYYGRNCNAFSECMRDLSWIAGSRLLCVVLDSDELLMEAERDTLAVFMRIMSRVKRELANPMPPPELPPVRWYGTLLHCSPQNSARFEARFAPFRQNIV